MIEPPAGVARASRRGHTTGYTFIEVVVVLALVSVLVGFAIPPLGRMRTRVALRNGRAMVTSALVETRTGATRFQRIGVLTLDAVAGTMRSAVDTAATGAEGDTLVLARFDLRGTYGVTLQTDREALCFDGAGVGTVAPACPRAGAQIVLRRGQMADTLLVNGAGRVWR